MPSSFQKTRVVFSVINGICFDQRVLKMAETVGSLNCDITIVGRKTDNCANNKTVPFRTIRFRMLFKRGFLFYMFFNIRLFFYLVFHKYDLLVSNDLDTLLPNYLVSRLKGIPLVYDSHEYFTNVPELVNRRFVKWVWTVIEKAVFPKLVNVITVSDPIADEYFRLYKIRPIVVRNAAKKTNHIIPFTRAELDVPENDLLIILQGAGINIDKGAEELIDAVRNTPGVTLLIVGTGDVVPRLQEQVKELKISQKVRLIPPVSWNTLMRYTKSADAGMCLEKDTNLNYRYSLPNKLFDYISAGIPVIASDMPETGRIISEYRCGMTITCVTSENISTALTDLKNNKMLMGEMKANAVIASESINWETESKKVTGLYGSILNRLDLT